MIIKNLYLVVCELNWINYWGWGSGDMFGVGVQVVIIGWLFYFFMIFCGLFVGEVGLIFGLLWLLEVIICLLIGYVFDNLCYIWVGCKIGW